VKLLFDENLSPRLPEVLADIYPDSLHVHECGLGSADDSTIWQYAKDNRFTIVSKYRTFRNAAFSLASRRSSFGFAHPTVRARKLRISCERLSRSSSGSSKKTRNRAWRLGFADDHEKTKTN
jgi:predicted nuclease of predicted toxin-antitoxin system